MSMNFEIRDLRELLAGDGEVKSVHIVLRITDDDLPGQSLAAEISIPAAMLATMPSESDEARNEAVLEHVRGRVRDMHHDWRARLDAATAPAYRRLAPDDIASRFGTTNFAGEAAHRDLKTAPAVRTTASPARALAGVLTSEQQET